MLLATTDSQQQDSKPTAIDHHLSDYDEIQITGSQLAHLMRYRCRTIQKKAVQGNWPYKTETGLGGQKYVYDINKLPDPVKYRIICQLLDDPVFILWAKQLAADEGFELKATNQPMTISCEGSTWVVQNHVFAKDQTPISETMATDKQAMRAELSSLALYFAKQSPLTKSASTIQFAAAYTQHMIPLQLCVYDLIPSLTNSTLYRWQKNISQQRYAQTLADFQFASSGQNIPVEHLLRKMLAHIDLSLTSDNISRLLTKLQNNRFALAQSDDSQS